MARDDQEMPTTRGRCRMAAKRKLLPDKVITALYRKDYETLQRLVNEDTVNLTDESDSTLLMLAISAIDADAQMVKFLIDRGADVNRVQGRYGYTALHYAAQHVQREIVFVLLAAGADTNARDSGEATPLHHLVRAPDPRGLIAMTLLNHGADPIGIKLSRL
jgi:ankyrin repeat protein